MNKKYVKDGSHNRFPAYCCEDIDKDLGTRVKELEEAVAALVAGTIPDGSVTLAKMAADAHTYMREINKGRLLSEWVGTQDEYDAHVAENGGEPLANVRYTITDRDVSYAGTAGELGFGWNLAGTFTFTTNTTAIDLLLPDYGLYIVRMNTEAGGDRYFIFAKGASSQQSSVCTDSGQYLLYLQHTLLGSCKLMMKTIDGGTSYSTEMTAKFYYKKIFGGGLNDYS